MISHLKETLLEPTRDRVDTPERKPQSWASPDARSGGPLSRGACLEPGTGGCWKELHFPRTRPAWSMRHRKQTPAQVKEERDPARERCKPPLPAAALLSTRNT